MVVGGMTGGMSMVSKAEGMRRSREGSDVGDFTSAVYVRRESSSQMFCLPTLMARYICGKRFQNRFTDGNEVEKGVDVDVVSVVFAVIGWDQCSTTQ